MKKQEKILIVDDTEQNLIALEALLEDCGAELVRATSGNAALNLMLKNDFALVLLDVQMPGMDGFETAELMHLSEKTKHIPIIFITAISKEEEFIFKGYQSGAIDYLPKPIDPVILKSKVKVFLDLWCYRQELAEALEENKKLTEKLHYQAQYDALTELPNRYLFKDRLEQALLNCSRTEKSGAVLFIDLDKFKPINDTLGHDVGDKLLKQVAQRLSRCVRASDTVARLGGDEFVIILQNLEDLSNLDQMGKTITDSIAEPFHIDGNELNISASVGIAPFNATNTNIAKELLLNADTAMYQAKAGGRDTYRLYQPDTSV